MATIKNSEQILTTMALSDLIQIQDNIFENSNNDDIKYDMEQVEHLTLAMKILSQLLKDQIQRYPENITPEY